MKGLAILLPWNVTLATLERFHFPNWPYINNVAYTTSLIVSQIIGQKYQPKSFSRCFALLATTCLCVPLQLQISIPAPYNFLVAIVITCALAVGSSCAQLVAIDRATADDRGLVISIGCGLAGPVAALYGDHLEAFYICAAACLVCAYWGDDTFYPPQRKKSPDLPQFTAMSPGFPPVRSPVRVTVSTASTYGGSPLSLVSMPNLSWTARATIMQQTLFWTYVLSFYCFPGRLLTWMPETTSIFQLVDCVGRFLPMLFTRLSWTIAPWLALLRLPFLIPILFPSLVDSFSFEIRLLLITLFAFFNGLVTSLILGQGEDAHVGPGLSMALIGGIVVGSWIGLV